jgi:peroxiredoxin
MLAAGDPAPAFSLPDLSGTKHTLAQMLSHGPVLAVLYKVSCPVCQLIFPFLQRISNKGFQTVAISQDDASATSGFAKTFGVKMLTLLDSPQSGYPVSNAFGITHVPSLFLIETDGVISYAGAGFQKTELEALSARAGSPMFRPEEDVPAWRAG